MNILLTMLLLMFVEVIDTPVMDPVGIFTTDPAYGPYMLFYTCPATDINGVTTGTILIILERKDFKYNVLRMNADSSYTVDMRDIMEAVDYHFTVPEE